MKLKRLLGALCAGLMLISLPAKATEQSSFVTPVAGPMNMATFAGTYLNPGLRALASCHWGPSAPTNGPSGAPLPYQCWANTTTNPVVFNRYDGASWAVYGKLNTSTHVWTPSYQGTDTGTASTATTGTSGHTVPFLDGVNTWSGAQAFGAMTATTINGLTFSASSGTLILNTNTLGITGSGVNLNLQGTGTTTQTFPTTSATLARTDAGQTFVGGQGFNGSVSVGSASANAFYVTNTFGSTGPSALNVDTSTASMNAGLNIKGAVSGGTVAVSAIDGSAANTNLSINAKGTGGITIGNVSTGNITVLSPLLLGGTGVNGSLNFQNTTSGNISIQPPAGALSGSLTLPNVIDTLMGVTAAQTPTNKTFNCANNTCTVRIASDVSGLGTGIATALGVSVGAVGAPVVNGGALGTPSSGVGTNLTGIPTTALTGTLQAAQEPAHTGDATNSAGSLAMTIAANAVTNAKLATMPAFTFHGNNTSGVATPTNVDIAALTAKASPVATDLVMISDQAASGAWKKVTISSLASAGSVASIAGNTGAFTLSGILTNSVNDLRVTAAVKADQTTATSTAVAVVPAVQQNHPSAAKAWVSFTGSTGAIQASYNIASVTRTSAGTYTIVFTTSFANALYACTGTVELGGTGFLAFVINGSRTTSQVVVTTTNLAGSAAGDAQSAFFQFFGAQ